MRMAPLMERGLMKEAVTLEPILRHPKPAVEESAARLDDPSLLLPIGVASFEHWLDLSA